MNKLTEFRQKLTEPLEIRGITLRTWPGGHNSPNLIELSNTPQRTVLYVKEFNVKDHPGFWGLTRNQVARLQAANIKWFAVLLLRSSTSGYLLSSGDVLNLIAYGSFELSGDGDFKVNEENDLKIAHRFQSHVDLLERIL